MKKIESKDELATVCGGRKPDVGDFLSGVCTGFSFAAIFATGPIGWAARLAGAGGSICDAKDFASIF